jgi:hypothetical protein
MKTITYEQAITLAASRATSGIVDANVSAFIVALFGETGSEEEAIRIFGELDAAAKSLRAARKVRP